MSPMDEMTWFDAPSVISTILAAGVDAVVAPANQRRVGLILCNSNAAGVIFFVPVSAASASKGIPIAAGQQSLYMTQQDYGALVQAEWHGFSAPGGTVTAIEVLLRDWPIGQPPGKRSKDTADDALKSRI